MVRWSPNTTCKCVFLVDEDFKFQEIEAQCQVHLGLSPIESFDSVYQEQKAISQINEVLFNAAPDELKNIEETKKIELRDGELVQVIDKKESWKEPPVYFFDEDRKIVMMFTDTHNDLKANFRDILAAQKLTLDLPRLEDVPEEKKQEYVDKMSEKIETITIL